MQEINILREKDLPYFERLEKEGKAVILRFDSLAALSRFDLSAYLGEAKKELTLSDVTDWMKKEAPVLEKLSEEQEALKKEIRETEDLLEKYLMLNGRELTGNEHVALMNMFDMGMKKEELDEIFDPLHTTEEIRTLIWAKADVYKKKRSGTASRTEGGMEESGGKA